ncbi:hypothetical protein HY389_02650 [Candidatus Daviesbacteria bacterium]|nr:hypothetical protein [Candidatus Daviesbacteria bacterium]
MIETQTLTHEQFAAFPSTGQVIDLLDKIRLANPNAGILTGYFSNRAILSRCVTDTMLGIGSEFMYRMGSTYYPKLALNYETFIQLRGSVGFQGESRSKLKLQFSLLPKQLSILPADELKAQRNWLFDDLFGPLKHKLTVISDADDKGLTLSGFDFMLSNRVDRAFVFRVMPDLFGYLERAEECKS